MIFGGYIMYNCKLDSLRGFAYKLSNSIINSSHIYPQTIILPLANSLQLFDGYSSTVIFQAAKEIAAIDMKGSLICLGEKAMPGQLVSAILVDIKDLDNPRVFNYQKTQINFIALSCDGEFICSVGSSSEGAQQLSIIEVNNQSQIGTRVFYSKKFAKKDGKVKALKFSHRDPLFFVLVFTHKVIFYRIDQENETVQQITATTSKVREYNDFIFSPDDAFLYGCSKNGDIAQISVEEGRETRIGPRKRVITKGITNIKYIHPGHLAISGKQGLMAIVEIESMKLLKEFKIEDEQVVNLTTFTETSAYISTNKANIYRLDAVSCNIQLIYTCHSTRINAIAGIKGYDEIFGTCSGGQIIIWRWVQLTPIIKISVPKAVCLSLLLPKTGKHIISGWNDDTIRIFSPANGKLLHKISNTSLQKVTCMISDENSTKMYCGGQNGVIRIWSILESKHMGLVAGSLAFHTKPIHDLKINPYQQDMMISCCEDGCFAVWNLHNFQLKKSFFICNFLKEIEFVDEMTVRVAGGSNKLYECLLSNGHIVGEVQLRGNHINCFSSCILEQTGEKLVVYGTDLHSLDYFDFNTPEHILQSQSYGPISKILMGPDCHSFLAITDNGIILRFSIFGSTKTNPNDLT